MPKPPKSTQEPLLAGASSEGVPVGIPVVQEPAAAAAEPWSIGRSNLYGTISNDLVPVPQTMARASVAQDDGAAREATLREWGRKRERKMHRWPRCLMDQMLSGSGLYPPRLLEQEWLTTAERAKYENLVRLCGDTGNPHELAMDLLSLLIYRVDVRIILDNSGSMGLDLFGQGVNTSSSSPRGSAWIDERTMENPSLMREVYRRMATGWGGGGRNAGQPMPVSGCSPHHRRWHFARDALVRWRAIFDVLGIDPFVYLLNGMSGVNGTKVYSSELDRVFANRPGGGTPMSEALLRALGEHNAEAGGRTLLLLVLTDGEANDMVSFNRTLDECQNGVYGDVQVCFMGLSLVAKDIEWFENEECDDTRIRTVEPYEVEQRQMQLKEVVAKEGGYTYAMHTLRVLVTNLFPADYDYEAPLQNLRHRCYITLHGRDRWWGLNNCCWRFCCSGACCCSCFVCSCGHCCGWCQGNECCSCKCEYPLWLEGCCEQE